MIAYLDFSEDLTKSLLPSLCKGRNYPSLAIFSLPDRQARGATCLREAASAKAGGRFSEQFVFQFGAALTLFYCLTLAFLFLLSA